jgi:hypothetical protein
LCLGFDAAFRLGAALTGFDFFRALAATFLAGFFLATFLAAVFFRVALLLAAFFPAALFAPFFLAISLLSRFS